MAHAAEIVAKKQKMHKRHRDKKKLRQQQTGNVDAIDSVERPDELGAYYNKNLANGSRKDD